MKNSIRTHTLSDIFGQNTVFIKQIKPICPTEPITYKHRDSYYLFLFLQQGEATLTIDFKTYQFTQPAAICILPGEVHFPEEANQASGWILGVSPAWIKEEYKMALESTRQHKDSLVLDKSANDFLTQTFSSAFQLQQSAKNQIEELWMHDLVACLIGTFSALSQKHRITPDNNRLTTITHQFKALLATHFSTQKLPSQYAALLHLSAAYLNEAVKATTGMSVTACIQQEVITQAQRLLFYTNRSVKEIAFELGYDDPAYFTRLFTRITKSTPSAFRKRYHE